MAAVKHLLLITTTVLECLGLALMIGGMLALGAFVAPAVFHAFPKPEAGAVMTLIFRRYDVLLGLSAILVVLGEMISLLWEPVRCCRWQRGIRLLITFLLAGSLGIGIFSTNPQIERFQHQGVQRGVGPAGQQFDQLHHQSESLYKFGLLLAIALLALRVGSSIPAAPQKAFEEANALRSP